MKIGVLSLQGSFVEHAAMIEAVGEQPVPVRLPGDLNGLSGLIIPGGESTTIGKLAERFALMAPMRRFAASHAVWGACAGMILMAKEVGSDQPLLGVMDISVARNAFGRQKESFSTHLRIPVLPDGRSRPFPAVFIRAPKLMRANADVQVIASLPNGAMVAARQGRLLVTAFHPELTGDARFHEFFARIAAGKRESG